MTRYFALGLLAALVAFAPAASDAAPKTKAKKGQTSKPSPVPKTLPTKKAGVPKSNPPTQPIEIKPAVAKQLAQGKPLPKSAMVKLARAAGLDIGPRDLQRPVELTPRRPYADNFTFLEAHGDVVHAPGHGTHGAISMWPAVFEVVSRPDFPIATEDDLRRAINPFHPDFEGVPGLDGRYIVVQFRAAPSKAYVVSCNVAGAAVFGAIVEANGRFDSWHPLAVDRGAVSLALPARSGRPVIRVKIAAASPVTGAFFLEAIGAAFGGSTDGPWSVNRCRITPAD